MNIERELMELKRGMEQAKTERDRAEGELDAALKALKEGYGFASTEEAEKAMAKTAQIIAADEAAIATQIERLKEQYDLA